MGIFQQNESVPTWSFAREPAVGVFFPHSELLSTLPFKGRWGPELPKQGESV